MSRILRWLMRLAPASFRRRYGQEIVEFLHLRSREIRRRRGRMGVWYFWITNVVDLLRAVRAERRDERRSRRSQTAAGTRSAARSTSRNRSGAPRDLTSALRPFRPALLLSDLRHAGRSLRRNPGPVLVSALALSLGIAATATMISVVDAIDFRPLPYRNAARLVELGQAGTRGPDFPAGPVSPGVFLDWQERTRSYTALAAASPVAVAVGDDERVLRAARASGRFFETLGVVPMLGRTFTNEEVRERARVLVISYDAWYALFGGSPDVIGRTTRVSWAGEYRGVSAESFTVIGVLPRGARYPGGSNAWLPAWDGFGESRRSPMLTVVGRLASGVSIAGAHAELDGVSRQLAIEYPDANEAPAGVVSSLRDAIQMMADQGGTSARFLLLSVAALVLVLAVINAAAVFLVRAAHQQQDLVVRVALGAPRSRLLTLLLGQSLIVSLAAGALGVLLSFWGIQIAEPRLAVSATGFAPVLDWRVIAAALTLAVIAGLAVGLLPAFRLWQSDLHGDLRARGVSGSRGGRLQRALVIAQVALALVLLSGAGALTRDFISLMTRDLGFAGDRLVVAWLPLTATHTDAADAAVRVARLPGVDAAALGGRSAQGYAYRLENGDSLTGAKRPIPYRVSADYFRTLGIPLLAGRGFLPDDRTGSTPVAIVSRLAARTWWPGEVPIGKQVEMSNRAGGSELVTIVGMTEDERVTREPQSPIRPILYRPWGQLENERRRTQIFVRTAEAESIIIPHVRAVTRSLRSGEGWQGDRVTTMTATLGNALELPRFRTSALTLFSIFGLLLAAMGIYGVVASVVSQRTPEIGIRLALGARPADVLGLVTRGGIGLAVAGMVLGLAGAFAAHRLLASVVVTATGVDLVAMLASAAFLAAVVSIACYMPGRRATRIDPTIALRE